MAKKKSLGEEIELNKVREMVRTEIEKRYGSIASFLKTPQGVKLGGVKIRSYLYDTGAVNFDLISKLCKYLGIGVLSRRIVVTRTYFYHLNTNTPPTEKVS